MWHFNVVLLIGSYGDLLLLETIISLWLDVLLQEVSVNPRLLLGYLKEQQRNLVEENRHKIDLSCVISSRQGSTFSQVGWKLTMNVCKINLTQP